MLSVSCKDAQHINRDMLHRDVKPASAIRRVLRLCASSWDESGNGSAEMGARAYSVSHPSVFQHHFWTGVPGKEWEEREEAGEHPASGKQTGRESGAWKLSEAAIFAHFWQSVNAGAAEFPPLTPTIVPPPPSINYQ